jgi:C-terminal processing protease CtpA/Prc
MTKLPFRATENPAEKLENLKNDLGFVPDYSYTDEGIRIATCLINRLADKAGLEAEDIIIQISEFSIQDLDDYVLAMNKLEKGREIAITVKRGKNEFKFFVVL